MKLIISKLQTMIGQGQVTIYGGIKTDQEIFRSYQIKSSDWKNATSIRLNRCQISGKGMIKIMSMGLDKLSVLDLSDDEITQKSIKQIKILDTDLVFKNLTFMNLDRNNIGCAGAKLLTRIEMPLLNTLYLGFGQIGSEGAKHLAKASWPNLFTLSIDYSFIKLDGFLGLVENNWKRYQSMYIGQTNLSAIEFMQFIGTLWTKARLYNFWTWQIEEGMEETINGVLENRFPDFYGSIENDQYQQEKQQEEEEEESMEEID